MDIFVTILFIHEAMFLLLYCIPVTYRKITNLRDLRWWLLLCVSRSQRFGNIISNTLIQFGVKTLDRALHPLIYLQHRDVRF